jgi:hypothetical protein
VTRATSNRHGVRLGAVLGALTGTALVVSVGFGSTSASAAGFGGSFSALAAADGVRVTVIVPNGGLADEVVDGGGPSAQARIDSLGTSKAFASFPYPGDTVANSPGLVRTLSGAPVPDPPFFVQSDHPIVPKQETGSGPYLLRAESSDSGSTATASVGLAAEGTGALGLVRSDAAVNTSPEAVVSEATSTVDSFTAGPLRLGHVVSHARVSLAADGKVTKAAETDIVGATVGATAVTITPGGLGIGDTKAPAPDTAPINQMLAGAGITVEVTPRQDLPSGVVAPAVRVTQTQSSGSKVIYVLGAASASSAGEAADSAAAPGIDTGSDAAPPSEAGSPTESGGPGDPNSTTAPATGLADPPSPAELTGAAGSDGTSSAESAVRYPASFVVAPAAATTTDASATESAAPPVAPTQPGIAPRSSSGRAAAVSAVLGTAVDAKPLYGVLVVGGGLALGVAVVMRGLRPGGTT